ncbi:hypothetical protein [Falsiphaeobacter marinintestinus]|uniref:hypothetical protein n=1 Tax=Falsiphaeobacter marinintestinus TaxID=1492905 RepID=UPI0011B68CA0|nr:hypothetical protein [Phaeobacter marinintestinus]
MAQDTDRTAARRVIIHCGVQKTASTAFHHFVQKNRDALSAQLDIQTPVKGSLMRNLGRSAALYSLGDEPEASFTGLIDQMREALEQGSKPALLSHENLPGAMLGRDGVVTLYPKLEDILGLLDAHLAPFKTHYVFHTRDMAGWKNSVYNQAVRSDSYAETRETFLQQTADCGTWADLEARVAAQVGADRVTFLKVEDEPERDRPGQRLLRLCGVSEPVLASLNPVSGSRNESLSPGALEFLRRVNGAKLPRAERRKVAKLILDSEALFQSDEVPG